MEEEENIRIGDRVPNFSYSTTKGDIILHQFLGNYWGLILCSPSSFEPVFLSEILECMRLEHELEDRHVRVCALTIEKLENQKLFLQDVEGLVGKQPFFPLLEDPEAHIASLFGLVTKNPTASDSCPEETEYSTVRGIFIVGPDKKVKAVMQYPLRHCKKIENYSDVKTACNEDSGGGRGVGASFHEILRCIDSLQLKETKNVDTPASWVRGQAVLAPRALRRFGAGGGGGGGGKGEEGKGEEEEAGAGRAAAAAAAETETGAVERRAALPSTLDYYATVPDPAAAAEDLWAEVADM